MYIMNVCCLVILSCIFVERILCSDFVVYTSVCMYVMILSCMLVIVFCLVILSCILLLCMLVSVYYLMTLHVCVGDSAT